MSAVERFLPLLVEGDTAASMADLGPEAFIFDVLHGPVAPPVVYFFLMARHVWLRDRQARVETLATTAAGGRAVVEQRLELVVDGRPVTLPVAIVGDEVAGGDGKLAELRVYHSTLPLTGRGEARSPVARVDEAARLAEPLATLHAALAAGDAERALACFAPDAIDDGIRAYVAARRALGLELCSVTDVGATCAVEYVAAGQAGLAVYERQASGLLRTARIYDDVGRAPG